ncbi:unnamed protein product, partial [Symbiodinium microadriaticum]
HAHGPALLASGALTSGMSTTGKPFVVRLHVADEWLRSVDAAIFAVGGSSSAGADCKSHTRLLCTPAYAADHPGWAGDYIRKTCIIGARAAVEGLQHSAVELTLQRCCLNNSKTSHLLRCNGDRVDSGRLLRFDEGMVGGAGLCTGRPSPRRQYKRLCRLMLEDSACEKRAPSPCPPSRLAPWLPKCANTLPLQASAPLRSLCRPTTPVLLRHGLCGCRVSPKLCTARDLVQRRWESFVRGCQAAAETTGGPPALAPGGRLIAALRTEDVERPHTRTANGACSPAAH